MTDNHLMIFVKNPVPGKAKTRLAASIGDQKALDIYKFLLSYTAYIASEVESTRTVYYSSYIEKNDMFSPNQFHKSIQSDGDLGVKMNEAFDYSFHQGYSKNVIIGSDCYELNHDIIKGAFQMLDEKDFVIGPAADGGYYLLGMKQKEPAIFQNKHWSSSRLYADTLIDFEAFGYSYHELPTLSDIDYIEDLPVEIKTKFNV